MDIGLIEFVWLVFVSIVLCMFVVVFFFVELSVVLILNVFGVNFVGFLLVVFKRFKLFLVLMMFVYIDLMFCVMLIVVYVVNMLLRMVKLFGRMLGYFVGVFIVCDRKEDSCDNVVGVFLVELVVVWVIVVFWVVSLVGLVVCCGEENGVNCFVVVEVVV